MVDFNGIKVTWPSDMSQEEAEEYARIICEKYKPQYIESIDILIDGEEVVLETHLKEFGFERIRRITGYLVGDLSRFNNGKLAEVNDRITHNI